MFLAYALNIHWRSYRDVSFNVTCVLQVPEFPESILHLQGRLQLRALPLRGQEPLLHLHALPQPLSR